VVSVTILNSPVATVIAALRPGDVLHVQLQVGPPRILQARNAAGRVAGSITCPEMPQIIDCIRKGSVYGADVLSVSGGRVQIRIHR